MSNEYIEKEEVAAKEKQEKKQTKSRSTKRTQSNAFVQILNGDFLAKEFVVNNLGFIFFIVFLLIMSVAKGYYAKQLMKDIDTNQKALDATTAEFVESKAKLEEETRRIELVNQLAPKGLKETTKPAKVIRVKKED
jgi:hypothetical protein